MIPRDSRLVKASHLDDLFHRLARNTDSVVAHRMDMYLEALYVFTKHPNVIGDITIVWPLYLEAVDLVLRRQDKEDLGDTGHKSPAYSYHGIIENTLFDIPKSELLRHVNASDPVRREIVLWRLENAA